jgi:hypothetical protein
MKGDFQVRFCENLRVQLPRVTRLQVMPPDRPSFHQKGTKTTFLSQNQDTN